jgi:NAD(P)-dependent dehydrogenase (short-subunit alcohol dehydrogenase family)
MWKPRSARYVLCSPPTQTSDQVSLCVLHGRGTCPHPHSVQALGKWCPDGYEMWRVHVQSATVLLDTLVNRLPDGARVVLIGSRTATGVAGKSQYAATKAALVALARSWAAELVGRAITVNVVAPGPTDIPMLSDPGRAHSPGVAAARPARVRRRGRRSDRVPARPGRGCDHRATTRPVRGGLTVSEPSS